MNSAKNLKDARPFMSAEEIASKKGVTFRTPISNGTCTYDLDALKRFINRRCETLDQKQCRKLTKLFRTLSKPKNAEAALEEWKEKAVLPTSYEHVKGFMLSRTRNETFCQQLSDQLAVCEQCQERPIPFKVAKDENAMQQHLLHHQQQSATRTQLYELLMSAL